MRWICIVGMGVLCGVLGRISISLSYFIRKIEDGTACAQCEKRSDCFAHRKILRTDASFLDEWILYSFIRVRRHCPYGRPCGLRDSLLYITCSALLAVVLLRSAGSPLEMLLYGTVAATLLSLSVVDWNTEYIPLEYNLILLFCGLVHLCMDRFNWSEYLIGLIAVSGFLFLVNLVAVPLLRKRYEDQDVTIDSAIGDGDIKLMAATGLLLGWKLNFLALGVGCVVGSVIHLIRMRLWDGEQELAFGPYLAVGVYIALLCGKQLIDWYLNMMGIMPM